MHHRNLFFEKSERQYAVDLADLDNCFLVLKEKKRFHAGNIGLVLFYERYKSFLNLPQALSHGCVLGRFYRAKRNTGKTFFLGFNDAIPERC